MNRLFAGQEPLARLQMLRDNAVRTERFSRLEAYSADDLGGIQQDLCGALVEKARLEAEFETVRDAHKAAIKPLDLAVRQALAGLRDKARLVSDECFVIVNQEAGDAEYYTKDGDLVHTRPLTMEERQMTMPAVLGKTGTAGHRA